MGLYRALPRAVEDGLARLYGAGVLPRDSHEISPTIGGGTQVDDFTKGFSKGKCYEGK